MDKSILEVAPIKAAPVSSRHAETEGIHRVAIEAAPSLPDMMQTTEAKFSTLILAEIRSTPVGRVNVNSLVLASEAVMPRLVAKTSMLLLPDE